MLVAAEHRGVAVEEVFGAELASGLAFGERNALEVRDCRANSSRADQLSAEGVTGFDAVCADDSASGPGIR